MGLMMPKKDVVTSNYDNRACEIYSEESDLLSFRDLCMITLTFFSIFCFSELSYTCTCCMDITIFDDNFPVVIKKSQKDQYCCGKEIVVSKVSASTCPYSILLKHLPAANRSAEMDTFYLDLHLDQIMSINQF